jgi:coatomer protein complex subunit alpha (xenin)
MVKKAKLIGQSIISYLQKKGYPEVALHFVKDEKTRFSLALECSNIEVALEAARALDDTSCWEMLANVALMLGNHQIVEMCYQRTKNFDKLGFLYLITGNTEKLKKMMKIAEVRKEVNSQFQIAMVFGDVSERLRILETCGQKSLAYLTATTHGLDSDAERLAGSFDTEHEFLPEVDESAELLQPGVPILPNQSSNWPLLSVSKGFFTNSSMSGVQSATYQEKKFAMNTSDNAEHETEVANNWGDDAHLGNLDTEDENDDYVRVQSDEVSGWDVNEDLDIGDALPSSQYESSTEAYFTAPTKGVSRPHIWLNNSKLAVDHILSGSFETAMRLLHEQVGIVNFEELRPIFMQTFARSRATLTALPSIPSLFVYPSKNPNDPLHKSLPVTGHKLSDLVQRLKSAYQLVTNGKFPESIEIFRLDDFIRGIFVRFCFKLVFLEDPSY